MEIREPTPDEVGHYDRNGWVKLERFVAPELAAELLERIQAKMGLDAGRAGADGRASTPNLDSGKLQALWQPWDLPSREDEVLYEFSHSVGIGRAASRLLRGRAARWYSDAVYAKLPAARTGSKTPWHQDFPYHAFDRVGMMNIWIALVDIPPEKGTMRFLSGRTGRGRSGGSSTAVTTSTWWRTTPSCSTSTRSRRRCTCVRVTRRSTTVPRPFRPRKRDGRRSLGLRRVGLSSRRAVHRRGQPANGRAGARDQQAVRPPELPPVAGGELTGASRCGSGERRDELAPDQRDRLEPELGRVPEVHPLEPCGGVGP